MDHYSTRGSSRFNKARHRGLEDRSKFNTVEKMVLCMCLHLKNKGQARKVVLPNYQLYQGVPLMRVSLQLCQILRKARVIHATLFQETFGSLSLILHARSAYETVEGVHKAVTIKWHNSRPLCPNPPVKRKCFIISECWLQLIPSAQMRTHASPGSTGLLLPRLPQGLFGRLVTQPFQPSADSIFNQSIFL